MRIDSSIAALLLKDIKGVNGEELELEVGETVDAKVLEILQDKVLLKIGGQKMYAKSMATSLGSSDIRLVFLGEEDGEIRFKVHNQDSYENGRNVNENSLSSALDQINVKGTEKNILIANKLLENNLSVTREAISLLEKILPDIASPEFESKLDFALLLHKKELPIRRDTLNLQMATQEENIVKTLKELLQSIDLNNFAAEKTNGADAKGFNGNVAVASGVDSQVEPASSLPLASVGKDLNFKSGDMQENIIQEMINTTQDNEMLNKESTNDSTKESTIESKMENNIPKADERIAEMLKAFTSVNDKEALARTIKTLCESSTTIKLFDLLERIEGLKEKGDITTESTVNDSTIEDSINKESPIKDSVINLIRGFSKEVLINTDKGTPFETTNTFINIPLKIEDQWYPASLQIKAEKDENNEVNFDRKVYVSINVETKNLDKVNVKLEVLKDKATCTINVLNELGVKVFSPYVNELKAALSETFKAVDVKINKINQDSRAEVKDRQSDLQSSKRKSTTTYNRVDLKI